MLPTTLSLNIKWAWIQKVHFLKKDLDPVNVFSLETLMQGCSIFCLFVFEKSINEINMVLLVT